MIFIYLVASALLITCGERESGGNDKAKGKTKADSTSLSSTHNVPQKPEPSKPIDQMNHQERNEYKEKLAKSGSYDCCIKPTCNMCLYEEAGQCSCAESVKKGEGVCGECHKGWQKGNGAVKGIDPKKVRRMSQGSQ